MKANSLTMRILAFVIRKRIVSMILGLLMLSLLTVFLKPPLRRDFSSVFEYETREGDGWLVQRLHSNRTGCDQKPVAVMTLLKNRKAWGSGRSFLDYLNMIQSFDYPTSCLSLNMLVSDNTEFDVIKRTLKSEGVMDSLRTVTLVYADMDVVVTRHGRNDTTAKTTKRRNLAMLRNHLLTKTLRDETYVLWVDADIGYAPEHLLPVMISSDKDIIIPRCNMALGAEYDDDKVFQGPKSKPNDEELQIVKDGGSFESRPMTMTKFLTQFEDSNDRFVEIDSVGATFLFVKAQVHRYGVIFPPMHIVGTGWDMTEGYDGIEANGLCYMARGIGFKCWGMPQPLDFTRHSF